MKTTVEFLDAVRTKHALESDYQLSKHLGCTRAGISSYRTGRSLLDEEMACKVATDLGLSTGYVLSCIASERAKKPEVKAAWAYAAQMLGGVAATVLIVLALPYAGANLELMNANVTNVTLEGNWWVWSDLNRRPKDYENLALLVQISIAFYYLQSLIFFGGRAWNKRSFFH